MALNPIPVADSIAAFIKANPPLPPGSDVTDAYLKNLWENIITLLYNDIKATAEVLPGTMNNPSGQPVTVAFPSGVGATTAPQPIAGEGTII